MSKNRPDALGDRMKTFERHETSQTFMPNTWVYIRIDGRGFSKFTKGLKRPYDERMSMLMRETTKYVHDNIGATISYTQSDESSFLVYNGYETNQTIFVGKKQKMISTIAALASSYFNAKLAEYLPEKVNYKNLPTFDCRAFSVPSEVEAMNAMYWRELDCIKNSISMSAHDNFSHKELHKVNSKEMKDMLLNCKGISWDEYPDFFKYGSYFKKIQYVKESELHEPTIRTQLVDVKTRIGDFHSTDDRVNFVTSKYFVTK